MRLPVLSSSKLCKFLEGEGFVLTRQNGSHRRYIHEDGRKTTAPVHSGKKIKKGLLLGVLKNVRMSRDEFMAKIS